MKFGILAFIWAILYGTAFGHAQELRVSTVTRPPFSMVENGTNTGFSIDLIRALAKKMGRPISISRHENFADMFDAVQTGKADLATANISITSKRETILDFSQPIFASGLQIMIPAQKGTVGTIWKVIFSRDLLLAVAAAFAILFGCGMLMWRFERHAQPYFNSSAKEAAFPAFWWALNLVLNGGFEERVPRSSLGRILGVFLVISSLFVVSIFVARITAAMTISAITSSVNSVNDLYGKRVGTITGSTAAGFLENRSMRFQGYDGLEAVLENFEAGMLDAVVFDAPILAYYVNTSGRGIAQLSGSVFLPENYGIALPSNSPLSEDINLALLAIREDGTYNRLYYRWFGTSP